LILCGWKALLDGLRVINERDPKCEISLTEGGGSALQHFVARKRDHIIQANFPQWRPEKKFETDIPTEEASDFEDEPSFAYFEQFEAPGAVDLTEADLKKQRAREAQARVKAKSTGPRGQNDPPKTPQKEVEPAVQQSKPPWSPTDIKTINELKCPCGKAATHGGYCEYRWQQALLGNIIVPATPLRKPQAARDPKKIKVAEDMLQRGEGSRAVYKATGLCKNTLTKLRKQLICKCECGKAGGHNGWCKARYAKSPARQAVIQKLKKAKNE
jgi:hypothetical protein